MGLAKHLEVSNDTVARIWKDHGLQQWKADTLKVSTNPNLEKLVDVVVVWRRPTNLHSLPPAADSSTLLTSISEPRPFQKLEKAAPSRPSEMKSS
jgi:hypothetical protein